MRELSSLEKILFFISKKITFYLKNNKRRKKDFLDLFTNSYFDTY